MIRPLQALCAVFVLLAPLPALAKPATIVKSPGGITAWLVEDHANPMIAVSLLFKGGAATDPEGKVGLATFVSGMLDEGAGEMDSQAFQTRLDDLNIEMGFNASRDSFSGSMTTLAAHRDEAFALLNAALTHPRFDAEPLERMRQAFQTRLRQRSERPNARAAETLFADIFPGHPYGRPTDGTPAGLAAITSADLHAFVKTRFSRDRLVIGVVGDIGASDLATLLDKTFGSLPATSQVPPVPQVKPKLSGGIIPVPMAVPQAAAVFVQEGPARADPDWHAFRVVMYALADGGFSSRLTEEVREKRGLAYGVGAEAAPLAESPLVVGSVGTQTAKIGESLRIIRAEWAKMRDSGPTDDEIAKAKAFLAGSLPLGLNSSPAIAQTLTTLQHFNLPPDELDHRAEVLAAISPETIRAVAKRWLTPERLTFAVAGEIKASDLPQTGK
jgi:zinc protease